MKKIENFSEDELNSIVRNSHSYTIALGLTAKGGNYTRARELAVKYNIKHILEP